MATVPAIISNHPTTAASGLGGSLSIVIMSLMLDFNVHISEEAAIAWTTLIVAFLGWLLRFLSHRFPVLELQPPSDPPSEPVAMEPAHGG